PSSASSPSAAPCTGRSGPTSTPRSWSLTSAEAPPRGVSLVHADPVVDGAAHVSTDSQCKRTTISVDRQGNLVDPSVAMECEHQVVQYHRGVTERQGGQSLPHLLAHAHRDVTGFVFGGRDVLLVDRDRLANDGVGRTSSRV